MRQTKKIDRQIRLLAVAALVAASAVSPWGRWARGEVVDRIVVVVNSEVITQSEVDRMLEPLYEQYRTTYGDEELAAKLEEARGRIVEQLIDDKLVLGEAKRQNVTVEEREIDEKIDEVKKRFNSNEEFEAALAGERVALRDLRARYREQIMKRRIIDRRVGSRIDITPVEVALYYQAHAEEFVQPEEIKVSNILIKPKEGLAPEKAFERAKEVLERIRGGSDFGSLAREYSDGPYASEGGLMGYIKKGDLLPEIEAAVFAMKEGEVSDVLQTGLGYHLFKVEEVRPRGTRSLSEVRHEVEEVIFRDKMKEKLKEWIEALKKNAYIAFK